MNTTTPSDETTLFQNSYFSLVKRPTDRGDYTFLKFNQEGVRILFINEQEQVYLVKQYREPVGRYLWEVPAGGRENDETALAAAQRELLEETGYEAGERQEVGTTYGLVNATNFKATLFIARKPRKGPALAKSLATTETTDGRFFSLDEIMTLIDDGELCDDKSIAALFRLQNPSK